MCNPSVLLLKLYILYILIRNRRVAHRVAHKFLAIYFLARVAPASCPGPAAPAPLGRALPMPPFPRKQAYPSPRPGCRSSLWWALLVTLRSCMSNGSFQKVQSSEDDGRNNVAMEAALPAATNTEMMQGLELKSQVHKGSMDGRNKRQSTFSSDAAWIGTVGSGI